MRLEPCVGCRRHVAVSAISCPFCGTPIQPAKPRWLVTGRTSRAAAFAGATLAACYTSNPPPQAPPPDHEPRYPHEAPAEPPPPPPDDSTAKPPAPTTAATVRGVITDRDTGQPFAGAIVSARAPDGSVAETRSDAYGAYVIANLPAGRYLVSAVVAVVGGGQARHTGTEVTLADKDDLRIDLAVSRHVRPPMPKPYGAPPARRRVV